MKLYKFITQIVAFKYAPKEVVPTVGKRAGQGRFRTHILKVRVTPAMAKAIAEVAQLPENANGTALSFGTEPTNGVLAININDALAHDLAAQAGLSDPSELVALGKGATVSLEFTLRYGKEDFASYGVKEFDTFVDRRDKTRTEQDVDTTHIQSSNVEITNLNFSPMQAQIAQMRMVANATAKAQFTSAPVAQTTIAEVEPEEEEEDAAGTVAPSKVKVSARTKAGK